MKKILIIHGPNLNLLGRRENAIYGNMSFEELNKLLETEAHTLNVSVEIYQSNHEGDIVEAIQKAEGKVDGIIINPAAYTHTSVAIRDAISAISIPVVEVHLSNIFSREEFRHKSLISPVAHAQICGFGTNSYLLAMRGLVRITHQH